LTATSLSTLPSLYGIEATRTSVSGVMGAGACVDNALAGTRLLGVARGVNARGGAVDAVACIARARAWIFGARECAGSRVMRRERRSSLTKFVELV